MQQQNGKPTIGFVILVWNSEKVIEKCLKSIIELKEIKPYIVLIDNGSTDSTVRVIEKFIDKEPECLTLIQYNENRGTTISRNAGINEVAKKNPDYYCILDSDTEISDAAFVKLINELKCNPQYGLIGPEMATSAGLIQMSARSFPTLLEKVYKAFPSKVIQSKGERMEKQYAPDDTVESYPVDYLMSACWLIKPEVIHNVGLLDEEIFYAPEDAEYCIRVWKKGFQVAFCPKVQIIHEWQRLSKKKLISKLNWEHIKGLVYMFKKHHYLFTTSRLKEAFDENREE